MRLRSSMTTIWGLALVLSCGSDKSADTQPSDKTMEDGGPAHDASAEDAEVVAEVPETPLPLTESEPPFAIDGATFAANVPCGGAAEAVFDIIRPNVDGPTPLILFIHGGGFNGGDKDEAWTQHEADVREALAANVAVASSNYRLLEPVDDVGVKKPLGDSAYCLQTLRYHARQLNIDPKKVLLMGVSAGAGTALWLGFHDEMADPKASDPVKRQSTRVKAVAAWETQATYDLVRWPKDVYPEYGVDLVGAAEAIGQGQRLLSFYAITDSKDLTSPPTVAYRKEVDMLSWMDKGDSPFWVQNANVENAPPLGTDIAFHHPRHAMKLKEDADKKGLEVVANIPKLGVMDPKGETPVAFLLRHL